MVIAKKSFVEHFEELRSRLLVIIAALIILFFICLSFTNPIINALKEDLTPYNAQLVSSTPLEYFYAQLSVAFIMSLLIVSPLIFYECFAFLKPGLKKNEKRILITGLLVFLSLLVIGVLFAYFVLLRMMLAFLAGLGSDAGVVNLWSINKFLGFVLWTGLGVGLAFETPLIVFLLVKFRVVEVAYLARSRRYVYVLILIIAGLITPPDVFSQIIVAVPMMLLFEASIIVAKLLAR